MDETMISADNSGTKIGLGVKNFDYTIYGENCGHEWRLWIRAFELFMKASKITEPEEKKNMLLHFGGQKIQELYDSLPDENTEEKQQDGPWASGYVTRSSEYEQTINKLNEFFLPKKNSTYERHILRQLKQEEGEKIEIFAMRLRTQAERCGFGEKIDENIKDQIIEKCVSSKMRREILKQGDATLNETLKMAKIFEAVNEQEKLFGFEKSAIPSIEINKIECEKAKDGFKNTECGRCGYNGHKANYEKCPAKGKTCNKCGLRDHFSRKCQSRKRSNSTTIRNKWQTKWPMKYSKHTTDNTNRTDPSMIKQNHQHEVNQITSENTLEKSYIFCVDSQNTKTEIHCKIGGIEVVAIIDSGSKYNLIDETTWKRLKAEKVVVKNQRRETEKCFQSYGEHSLTILGVFEARLVIGNRSINAEFYVIKENGKVLIGRDTAMLIGILKIDVDINEIGQVDKTKIGKIKGVVVDIPIKPYARPVVQPYRRVPLALEEKVNKKIDELKAQGVIEKVEGPSNWISPMVVVPKGDDVRICIDMRCANEAVERENYPLPTIEDLLPHLGQNKWFSRIDVRQAFHQVEISEKSRYITTFITRKGLFRYTRLMFGITCAPELFQKIMEQILSACEGCFNYIDDVVIYGSEKEVHDVRLRKVLETLKDYNVTINEEKCAYGVRELEFLGHKLSERGIAPTSDKVVAIKQFRKPLNAEEIRSFLGLVNYVGKFIPNLATVTEPLRKLTKKSYKFKWDVEQQTAFESLKETITSDMILGYYDIKHRTILITDASPVGLGAVLVQINEAGPRIIEYASKSLSDVERRYAQTEKEALALVWAAERFHFYLFGRSFDLITDHKPLEIIFGTRSKPCARIERWVLRLQSYKYKVIYKPGKSNIADPLSRLLPDTIGTTFDEISEHHVNSIVEIAAPIAIKILEIEQQSKNDNEIQAVKKGIYEDTWTTEALPFKVFKTELCFAGEILLRGNRIVIPEQLRQHTLELAHEGHPGMTVMKRRLRAKVWWPKIDQAVESNVKKCRGCILVAAPDAPEPLKRKELPTAAWQHVAIDFLGPLPSGHNLFVVVDYYSRFVEIEIMKKIDSSETIKRLRNIFARFGYPWSITADNGRQLISDEFRDYCNANNIKLISTIPFWPQQNGEVERQNRSILKRLIISQNSNRNWQQDLNEYLMMYRSTQHSTTLKTPSEMMFGWNIRDKLPSISQPIEFDEETRDRDKEKKEKEKVYADIRRNAIQNEAKVGDKVFVMRQAKVNKLSSTFDPTTYSVVKRNGSEVTVEADDTKKLYRRNVAHVKKLPTDSVETQRPERCVKKPKRYRNE